MKKYLAGFWVLWLLFFSMGTAQPLASGYAGFVDSLASEAPVPPTPQEVFANPFSLRNYWGQDAPRLETYSPQAMAMQRALNEREEAIWTYSPLGQPEEWVAIDSLAITPYTWKWVKLSVIKKDQTESLISLRRPNQWLKKWQANEIGNTFWIELPELGIQGTATVTAILPNQLDSRLWDEKRSGNLVLRPLTGYFQHTASELVSLSFKGSAEQLVATSSHPVKSVSRNAWVKAGNLAKGEHLFTRDSAATIVQNAPSLAQQQVYNLEVYRDHNYFVSELQILVHNNCFLPKLGIEKFDNMDLSKASGDELEQYAMAFQNKYKSGDVEGMTRDQAAHFIKLLREKGVDFRIDDPHFKPNNPWKMKHINVGGKGKGHIPILDR